MSLGCFVAQNLSLPRELISQMTQGLSKHTKLMVMKFDFIQLELGISLEFKVHYQRFGVFGQCKRRLKVENVMKVENVTEILSKKENMHLLSIFPCLSFSYLFSSLNCIFPSQLFQLYSNQFSTTSPYFGFQKTNAYICGMDKLY